MNLSDISGKSSPVRLVKEAGFSWNRGIVRSITQHGGSLSLALQLANGTGSVTYMLPNEFLDRAKQLLALGVAAVVRVANFEEANSTERQVRPSKQVVVEIESAKRFAAGLNANGGSDATPPKTKKKKVRRDSIPEEQPTATEFPDSD
jgi:hypothetical protein